MATPFSRTIRSLSTDNYYISLVGLGAAILLALIWTHWFITTPIVSYEISEQVYVTSKESLTSLFPSTRGVTKKVQVIRQRIIYAEFQNEAIEKIRSGQAAFVHIFGNSRPISATVVNVIYPTVGSSKGTVVLQASIDAAKPNPFFDGEGGKVQIEVEHITPATFVLRASGLLTETPPLSVSPQKYQ